MEKAVLQEKAWVINKNNFKEPYFAPDGVYYAKTSGKAKQLALSDVKDGEHLDYLGEPIRFLTLKVNRCAGGDKYLVDGKILTASQIDYYKRVKEQNEKIDKLVEDNPNAMAYIRKGGNYYKPNNCGYTERLFDAGIYTIQDAAKSVRHCDLGDGMRLIVIDNDEHNKMINDKIEDLKSRLISFKK